VQLWLDAADGTIHHHDGQALALQNSADWFDPTSGVSSSSALDVAGDMAGDKGVDVGEQHDSAPVSNDGHLLLMVLILLPAIKAGRLPLPRSSRSLPGRSPRIPLPPPRWMSATA
jgi:hypothetical protein